MKWTRREPPRPEAARVAGPTVEVVDAGRAMLLDVVGAKVVDAAEAGVSDGETA
jgi:hypothetical protein